MDSACLTRAQSIFDVPGLAILGDTSVGQMVHRIGHQPDRRIADLADPTAASDGACHHRFAMSARPGLIPAAGRCALSVGRDRGGDMAHAGWPAVTRY
jgi:hypothetical protein